ncbi:MAG: nicotinate-nucleotide diphosphorylase (carboxylating), partial [Verrucomicrobia bacterium]|nr:nicotinate-nucleotide diphosphorylase (carboxylating) [Verrucomicrobiota bacterium]
LMGDGRLSAVIRQARRDFPDLPLVVEADSVKLAEALLGEPVDRILLDNLSSGEVAQVVNRRNSMGSPIQLEASGGVNLEKAKTLARAGVEWISVGSLTHSAKAIDFSLDIQPCLP